MKSGFIRVFWGSLDKEEILSSLNPENDMNLNDETIDFYIKRRKKVEDNLKRQLRLEYNEKFIVYLFGENNITLMKDLNLNYILVDKNPYLFGLRNSFIQKLVGWECASEDFDEFIFLDWDTKQQSELPNDFWERMNKKEIVQASLWKYKTPKIKYREKNNNITPAGGFVYIRGKNTAKEIMKCWKNEVAGNKWSAEPPVTTYIDKLSGGWKGIDYYWNLFEPEFYHTKNSPYRFYLEKYNKEEIYFRNRGHSWRF